MKILSVSVTAAGREQAARLPWPSVHGSLAETVRDRWADVDAFVLFAATGLAVRVIAPLLRSKAQDPAIVCVDQEGNWAVALSGGHGGGANTVAREVAALLGAQAVITTATDAAGLAPLDQIPGMRAEGDVAGVTRAILDGEQVGLLNALGWPLPAGISDRLLPLATEQPGLPMVIVTASLRAAGVGVVLLRPQTLTVGVGASSGAPAAALHMLATTAVTAAGFSTAAVAAIATLDHKRTEPAIVALAHAWGVSLRDFPATALAAVDVPNPSEVVTDAVGTPSVAEAAALLAAGPGAALVVPKQRSATATVAIAQSAGRGGRLRVVGLGPGGARHRTPAATTAVRGADVVIGYGPYIDLAADAIAPGADVQRSPIGDEIGRASSAIRAAAGGQTVALVCSGDAGVYALASLVFELAAGVAGLDAAHIEVVPGVTAALASAAALGAPLGHDHVAISLSDLLTPWAVIERRLTAAAEADFVVSLYNPRSAGRDWQLGAAIEVLARHRPAATPVGAVTDAGRPNEHVVVTTIADFRPDAVGMTTCVVVGASSTRMIGGRMVTPRGYRP